jgi:hypothetical protein
MRDEITPDFRTFRSRINTRIERQRDRPKLIWHCILSPFVPHSKAYFRHGGQLFSAGAADDSTRVKDFDTSIASEIPRIEGQDGRDAMKLRVRTGTAPGSLPARNAGRPWRFPSFPRPSPLPARCNRLG